MKRQRNPKGQSRIDNPEEMAILRTQEKQNKKTKTQKTKKIIMQIYVFTSLQKKRFALGITLDLRNYKAPQ